MTSLTLNYNSFGGPENVFAFLCSVGITSATCPECHAPCAVEYLKDRQMPRLRCACGYRRSCFAGTVFEAHKIEDVPLFMFVMRCYVLRVSLKAISGLTGSKEKTVSKYLTIIKDTICISFEEQLRNENFMFGGPDKVVEIDEAFLSTRKYYCGRKQAKEGVWVVGMTEVNTSTREIDDPALLQHVQEREARMHELSLLPRRRFKKTKKAARVLRTPFEQSHSRFQVIDGGSLFEEIEEDREEEMRDLEREIRTIFSQRRKGLPKKTLFFIVESRDAATLTHIIKKLSSRAPRYSPTNGLAIATCQPKDTFIRRSAINGDSVALNVTTTR